MDFASVEGVLNRTFAEPLQDYVNRENPVIAALQKKAVSSDRVYIKGAASSDHGAGAVPDGSDVTLAGTEGTDFVAPTLDWATYIGKFRVNARVLDQLAAQEGELGNILQYEIQQAAKDAADAIAADVFKGAVANGIVGLQAMIDDANTWGGIDRSQAANANLRSAVYDVGTGTPVDTTTELSTAIMYEADRLFFNLNGYGFTDRPGLFTGITTDLILNKYKLMFEDIDLSALSNAHFVNRANSTGQLGLGSVGFAGVPVIRDRNVDMTGDLDDSGRFYFLDMSQIHLAVLTPNSNLQTVHQTQGYMMAPNAPGLRFTIKLLGRKGEYVEGYVSTYVQLATPNPKKAGMVIKNIKAD